MLKWLGIFDFTLISIDKYPIQINLTNLYRSILLLDNIDDDPIYCSKRILGAVQQCWISEM